MKTSQIVAKAVLRLFLLLVLIACFVFLHNDNAKLQQFNFVIVRKWTLIFPFILIAGFITLLINCVVNKYKKTDMNWLLVVNTVVLIAYLAAIVLRVYQEIN
jgi:hypothetical protein